MLRILLTAALLLTAPLRRPPQPRSTSTYTFMPGKIIVHPGNVVTWNNQEFHAHTATSLDGASFDSGAIIPGASWTHTFKKPGTYKYHCVIHPDMQGEVDVE